MCLTTFGNIKKAETDIVVYKVLLNYGLSHYSPYMTHFEWKVGEINKIKEPSLFERLRERNITKTVGSGYFHSYAKKVDAEKLTTLWDDRHSVFSAVIPKGTWYYEGYDDTTGGPAYASKKLKIVDEVE